MSDLKDLARRSSAVTLSDMEVFIFPELIYSLLLANIMSPRIWKWREDPWFSGIEGMKPYRRITRLKQFIMDHYQFNLDLDTWGLTTKERELARFSAFIDEDTLANSNALFGYEGDKYYFDIDIRTHFGLDKYEGNVIPYWKTETVEAMDAFQYRDGYTSGAGECVSLAAIYAAALFIVARIPLKDIYLMASPLHSQNFVDVNEGILTNNRRLVTKAMWFNGTALSAQARRALENERVTIVAHESGLIHALYPEASISRAVYDHFTRQIREFLSTPLNAEVIGNFLRHNSKIRDCFQMRWARHGVDHYISVDRVLAYETNSSYRMTDTTRTKLLEEIDAEEFHCQALPSRVILNDLEQYVKDHPVDIHNREDVLRLKARFASDCINAEMGIESLVQFCHIDPRLPDADAKQFVASEVPLNLDVEMERDEIITRLSAIRERNSMAALAFYAYRDLNQIEPEPFLQACFERNPCSVEGASTLDDDALIAYLVDLPNESIYDEAGRLAQPDEVWNYSRGDGAEKAVLAANVLRERHPGAEVRLSVDADLVTVDIGTLTHTFPSAKGLHNAIWTYPASK
ncbi:MAG: hypothetical protein O3C57_08030 [Verrucomicrobia bacterium]|nr:hypothetical protein [Verrucomicrobiota bacterium]